MMVPSIETAGYRGNPYGGCLLTPDEGFREPVRFFWFARTPTGRQSIYWKVHTFFRLSSSVALKYPPGKHQDLLPVRVPTKYFAVSTADLWRYAAFNTALPRLRRGYEWTGPYLLEDSPVDLSFGFRKDGPYGGGKWVLEKAPEHSDGIPIRYEVHMPSGPQCRPKPPGRVLHS